MVNAGILFDRSCEAPSARAEREDAWDAMCRGLSDRQRRAVTLTMRRGWTPAEVGAELGLTARRVRQILDETIALLRDSGKYKVLSPH